MDVTTATPTEIDTEIARLHQEAAHAESERAANQEFLNRYAEVEGTYEADHPWFAADKVAAAREAVTAAKARATAAKTAVAPLEDEFVRRGGWERYYLVANTGGHVHWTTGCSTCFPTTEFAWLTYYSGVDRAAFVEEAGTRACTVCFPDAPVEVYSRATRIEYESAEAKARREERETKAAAKVAAEVVVHGYTEFAGRPRTKTFKTARGATNAVASDLTSLCIYGESHPDAQQWVANVAAVRTALAEKGVEFDYDAALARARRKVPAGGARY